MSKWRRVAIEFIPTLARPIAAALNRAELWSELRCRFIEAEKSQNPALCASIVKYYRWCVSPERQRLPNDIQTSAVLGFLEDLVEDQASTDILLKWLSKDEVLSYSWNVEYSAGMSAVDYIRLWKPPKSH